MPAPIISNLATSPFTDLLEHADFLCDTGMYLQVMPLIDQLNGHENPRGQLIANRAISHLGNQRGSHAALTRLWRANRSNSDVAAAYLMMLTYYRGAWKAWNFARLCKLPADTAPEVGAQWLSSLSYIHGTLRDFDTAKDYHQRALQLNPADPWIRTEWAYVLEIQDRYEDAIALTKEVLQEHSNYRSTVQALGHFYTLVGKDDEALALMAKAVNTMESSSLACQLFNLQLEHGLCNEARESLVLCDRYAPLADKPYKSWLAARETDIAIRLGENEQARSAALCIGGPFYEKLAERLLEPGIDTGHKLLPVPFVRQNYMTCAPATLTALCQYWGHSVDHLDIAEKICYDGTPHHSERKWVEDQGFVAAEFTVNWDVTRALIDAGVPFTLTTVYTGGAHLQAVIGYNDLYGSLLIRDPFERSHREFEAQSLFESHKYSGPRGMLLVPQEEKHRIDGILLPDAKVWTSYYHAISALQQHDRDTASGIASDMQASLPTHTLTVNVKRALAMYDGNEPAVLETTETLLAEFPKDVNLQLSKAASLSFLGTHAQQIAWLRQMTSVPYPEPLTLIRLAGALEADQREATTARKLLQKALSRTPNDAYGWYELASLNWRIGERDTAFECFRIASCLALTNEDYAVSYFRAGALLKKIDAALAHLKQRHRQLSPKSVQPLITLFQQMEAVDKTEEAFQMLEEALATRHDDAALVIFAADTYVRYRKLDAAKEMLGRSELAVKQATSLRSQAGLARELGEPERALKLAQEALELEPLNLVNYRQVCSLLDELYGQGKVIAFLREACERFRFHCGLHELLADTLRSKSLIEAEQVLRHLVALNPNNQWAQRELAANLARQLKTDEAYRIAQFICEIAPTQSYNLSCLAYVLMRKGNMPSAREQFRQALRLSIDNDYALSSLLSISETLEDRRDVLDFVRAELIAQVTVGDALYAFQSAAQSTLTPDERLAVLREALAQRPDLSSAWIALGIELIEVGKLEEASDLLEKTVDKFPLLPRAYAELARVQVLTDQRDKARETLKTALQINPYWSRAARDYSNIFISEGKDLDVALKAVDIALPRNSGDAELQAQRADLLTRMGRHDDAVAEVKRAVQCSPSLSWPWGLLRNLGQQTSDANLLERTARELTQSQPENHWCWIRLAQYSNNVPEALDAADRALKIDPFSQYALQAKLDALLANGRYEEMKLVLENLPWTDFVPIGIRAYNARLAKAKGWTRDALKIMQGILEEDANDYGLWQEYADWCDGATDYAPYLYAAENMLRLYPNYYVAHGYYADALIKNGQKHKAMPHLERAFALDPSYSFAGYKLLDHALEQEDANKAASILEALEVHIDKPAAAAKKIEIAIVRHDRSEALAQAKHIFEQPDVPDWAIKHALDKITEADWHEALLDTIRETARSGYCNPDAVRHFINHQGKGFFPSVYRDVKRLLKNDPHHSIKKGFLRWLAAHPNNKYLDRFVKEFGDQLRNDLQLWCEVSYTYICANRFADTVKWMQGWQQRSDIPTWALGNIALSLRSTGQHALAREATMRSLQLEPNNAEAKVWLALDAARAQRDHELKQLLQEACLYRQRDYYANLLRIMYHYLDGRDDRTRVTALNELRLMRKNPAASIVAKALAKELATNIVNHRGAVERAYLWLRYVVL